MKLPIKLLTNESFIGTLSLTILGGLAIYFGHMELAGVAVGGIAAMVRGTVGENGDKE